MKNAGRCFFIVWKRECVKGGVTICQHCVTNGCFGTILVTTGLSLVMCLCTSCDTNTTKTIKMNINKLIFSTMNIKPLADRVLIEPAEAEQKTASGIIIPDTAKEKPQRGKVVAVGAGTKDHDMTVKVGDQVLYGKYSGTEVDIDGTKYMIMKESDIYAII